MASWSSFCRKPVRFRALLPRLAAGFALLLPLGGCGGADVDEAPVPRGATASAPETGGVEPREGAEGSSGPVLLFVGTSLTEGLGLTQPSTEAWPARIEARAREAGLPLTVRNAGLSGETSAGVRRRITWLLAPGPEPDPDIVILESGANDGLRGLPPLELEANLDGALQAVREALPDARLVVVGMEAPPNLGEAYTEAFREVFPRVAARWEAALVPFLLEGVAGVAALNQDDGIHPTAEGHDRMAEVAWPVLRLLVEASGR